MEYGLISEANILKVDYQGDVTTVLFNTDDETQINMLRRSLMSEIPTYAIDVVTFFENTSPRHDEVIAFRLGQLPIDHDSFLPNENDEFETEIKVDGPGEFNTDHIPGLPFKHITPITVLKSGQSIHCKIIVKKGTAKIHAKWRPVALVYIDKEGDFFKISFKNVGMMSSNQIIQQGLHNMKRVGERQPHTIFSFPLLPSSFHLD